jgi:hypothetical protein
MNAWRARKNYGTLFIDGNLIYSPSQGLRNLLIFFVYLY